MLRLIFFSKKWQRTSNERKDIGVENGVPDTAKPIDNCGFDQS